MAFRNQFDNKILFVLRGEHVQGASKCIVGFPASEQVEGRMGPILELLLPRHHSVISRFGVLFLHIKFRKVSSSEILVHFYRVSDCEEWNDIQVLAFFLASDHIRNLHRAMAH